MKYYLGIDIGGTKTAVGLFGLDCTLITQTVFATEPQNGCADLVCRIGAAYKKLLNEKNITPSEIISVGVASPGPLNLKTGRIVHIPTMGFRDEPIRAMLEKELNQTVVLENDANCAALTEAMLGAGKGMNPVAYVTVSTGIGCGIVVNGKIVDGFSDCAGELGHITVHRNGRNCPCGKKGCLELYASGTALAREATRKFGIPTTAKELFVLARSGNVDAVAIIQKAVDDLAFGLSALCTVLNPQVIVLGGSVTKDYDVFEAMLRRSFEHDTQPVIGKNTRIVLSQFDGAQVLYGAVLNAIAKTV